MNIVNLTPHTVVVKTEKETFQFEASGITVRVNKKNEQIGEIGGIPLVQNTTESVVFSGELPEADFYIVSAMVLAEKNNVAVEIGKKFIAPDTNKAQRNDAGHIVSVPGFCI